MWSFKRALAVCTSSLSKLTTNVETTCSPRLISTDTTLNAWTRTNAPRNFLRYNKTMYPPLKPDEPQRPAYVCHQITNIKYSPEKMWYVASFVRGMSVDEAVRQLSFVHKKGAPYVKQAILEAQKLAVEQHNVEFKSNLWVAESFASKGAVIKGIRRHAKARVGKVEYRYCHYFVRLEEGPPPKNYYHPGDKPPEELLDQWLENMRKRKIYRSL